MNVPVIQKVPAELTQPVPEPKLRTDTNGGLANYVLALQAAYREVSAKLAIIAEKYGDKPQR